MGWGLCRALAVAQVLGDVVSGEVVEPEMLTVAAPSMGGLLDSIAGGMGMGISGIAARAKPVAVPVAAAAATATSAITGSGGKVTLKSADKEALRNFISGAMPFGWYIPLPVIFSNCFFTDSVYYAPVVLREE
jgi:AP-5 complex subunit mu-1